MFLLKVDRSEEMRQEVRLCARFQGDIPVEHRSPATGVMVDSDCHDFNSGAAATYNFTCTGAFVASRASRERRENVLYSADGLAWSGVRVDPFCSISNSRGAGLHTYARQRFRAKTIGQGTIIQCQHPRTYGDWVSEHLKILCLADGIPEPIILPGFIGHRPYVRYEMERLGLDYISIDGPVLIRDACVLHKPQPRTYWDRREVQAFRKRFNHSPAAPEPGSILFLSRAGVSGANTSVVRDYRSDVTREAVESLDGKTVETGDLNMDDFIALAPSAETLVADHGAAMFNMLHWNTRNIVELVSDNWWSNCFVFLSVACGVENHVVVRCEARSKGETQRLIVDHIQRLQRADNKHSSDTSATLV